MYPRSRSDNKHLSESEFAVNVLRKVGEGKCELGRKEVRLGCESKQNPKKSGFGSVLQGGSMMG